LLGFLVTQQTKRTKNAFKFQISKSLLSPERLPASQGFGRRGFAQVGKCQMNVKIQVKMERG